MLLCGVQLLFETAISHDILMTVLLNTFCDSTVVPPVSAGDTLQDLPRMPETADSSEPYI
jgi:hypothetical protein